MSILKTTLLAAVAAVAFASPSLAQNFQGFGAPSWVTESNQSYVTQDKPVMLKSHKATKHHAAEK
jgi:hypothetical protein